MRTARVTWEGALHHVMNRGLNKQKIFETEQLKKEFINLTEEKGVKYGISIFAYCIMDNHFHIALENTSGNLSEFMRSLNGQFGHCYRRITNTKGYVFEDRFKSTVVQNDEYLLELIMYILLNPVRKGYLKNPFEYKWSSAREYFNSTSNSVIKKELVEDLFGSRDLFYATLVGNVGLKLNESSSKSCRIHGDQYFKDKIQRIDAGITDRLKRDEEVQRIIHKIIRDFEKMNLIKMDYSTIKTKKKDKIKKRLLFELMTHPGVRYRDLMNIEIFKNIKYTTLRKWFSLEKNK